MLKLRFNKAGVEAGCDEAGRGCLAGPVHAAAVILPPGYRNKWLNDSKKLTERDRYELRDTIQQKALAWAVGVVSHTEIDEINILNASFLAMHRAIEQLTVQPELLLIDGNRFNPYPGIRHQCVIGGDAIFMSIAAASILAKTYRDDHMKLLDAEFPQFQWGKNKGYATPEHREAIKSNGHSPYHRLSFRLVPDQLELDFFD